MQCVFQREDRRDGEERGGGGGEEAGGARRQPPAHGAVPAQRRGWSPPRTTHIYIYIYVII